MHSYGGKLRSRTTVYGGVPMDPAYTAGKFPRTVKRVEKPMEQTKKYVCDICGRPFDFAVALAGHKRSHQ